MKIPTEYIEGLRDAFQGSASLAEDFVKAGMAEKIAGHLRQMAEAQSKMLISLPIKN